jgi:hypothetical protein
MIVEIVDAEEKIRAFLPTLAAMVQSGLVTLERVTVLRYCNDPPGGRNSRLRRQGRWAPNLPASARPRRAASRRCQRSRASTQSA